MEPSLERRRGVCSMVKAKWWVVEALAQGSTLQMDNATKQTVLRETRPRRMMAGRRSRDSCRIHEDRRAFVVSAKVPAMVEAGAAEVAHPDPARASRRVLRGLPSARADQ